MAIGSGTRLGSYEVVAPIGAGGMGEVYLARDSKLDREVAIKVLPVLFARDAERVARFQREAKVLASLNHPNIAAIYGFEEYDEERFLVMELVDGETLLQRVKNGAMPVEEALSICRQITEALEAAHDKGIIHRDLKPGNVMLKADGTVKVLDFGLAKALALDDGSQTDIAHSPTITADHTRPGVILGTAPYMSPEQARGKPLDKRTDIWSFGVVLYECLGGRRPFDGETATDLIAKILEREPDWTTLPADTPPTVQLLLRRCLEKDRNKRLRDIGDARIEIENAIADPTSSSLTLAGAALRAATVRERQSLRRRILPLVTVLLGISLAASLTSLWRATRPVARLPLHLNVEVSPDEPIQASLGAQAVLSQDGTRLVFSAGSGSGAKLYIRRLDQSKATPLSGTEGANDPFFSPNGEWIGFFAGGKLKKVSVSGGAPISLCNAQNNRGGTWCEDGRIIFVPNTTTGLWRVQESGGAPQQLTTRNEDKNERSHRWPQILPGGRAALFTAQTMNTNFNDANIEVFVLETGERKVMHHGGSYGRYLPTGHIVFVREGTLFAAPFDIERLEVAGTPAPILEGITSDSRNGGAQFAFSETGTLVYHAGSQNSEDTSFIWVDRQGKTTPLLETVRNYSFPSLSPDGQRLAMQIWSSSAIANVWVYDIARGALTRLTFGESFDIVPQWSPDGTRIAFASERDGGVLNLYWKRADGSGEAERLTTSEHVQIATDWSPNGKTLVFMEEGDETGPDIWLLGLEGDGKAEPFLRTPFQEDEAVFSPDGHWLAYNSNESGQDEVYVRPFPKAGGKWQISTGGGRFPVWSHDGKEMFYRNSNALMAVSVTAEGSSFKAEKPELLFELESGGFPYLRPYDIASDGQRFVWLKRAQVLEKKDRSHLQFVFNWFDQVKAKAPAGK